MAVIVDVVREAATTALHRQRGRCLAILASIGCMIEAVLFGRGAAKAAVIVTALVVFGAACLIRYGERHGPAPIVYLVNRPDPEPAAQPELVAEIHDSVATQNERVTELFERMLGAVRPDQESA